jgi:hypothetical protein
MGDVFDRWRLNCGWNPWDNATQMAAISSFVATLDRESIPASAYMELYERAIQMRTRAVQDGKALPAFGAELLLACWLGDWGLRNELRQREIDARRTLTGNAESVCRECHGSGWRTERTEGYSIARKCDHGNT